MSKINYDLERIKGIVFDVDRSSVALDNTHGQRRNALAHGQHQGRICPAACRKARLQDSHNNRRLLPAIKARFNGLGITDIYMKAGKKIDVLKQWMDANGLLVEEVAYVGDDIPDYEVMQHAASQWLRLTRLSTSNR